MLYQLTNSARYDWDGDGYDTFEYYHEFDNGTASGRYDNLGNRPHDKFVHRTAGNNKTWRTTYTYKQFSQIDTLQENEDDDGDIEKTWTYHYDDNGNLENRVINDTHYTEMQYEYLNMMKDFDNSLAASKHGQ